MLMLLLLRIYRNTDGVCTDESGFRSRGFRSWLPAICTQQPCQSSRGKEVSADPAAEQGEVEMNQRCMWGWLTFHWSAVLLKFEVIFFGGRRLVLFAFLVRDR